MAVLVTVLVDGRATRSVDIAFRLKRTVMGLVAKRALDAHTVLTADDVSITEIEMKPGEKSALKDIQSIVGKRTLRQISMGQPLLESTIESAPIIVAGAKVTLEVVVGGVVISCSAIARNPGALGESIRVYSTETKKELTGVIIDKNTVRVEEPK